jgi:hypothetical protein
MGVPAELLQAEADFEEDADRATGRSDMSEALLGLYEKTVGIPDGRLYGLSLTYGQYMFNATRTSLGR